MTEADLHRALMKAASRHGARLFRNNVGTVWTGKRVSGGHGGVVVLEDARVFHAGLAPGSSDLIGYVPVTVTREMVGQSLAVFASVEVKMPRGRPTDEQMMWINAVDMSGGRAGIARSEADLVKILGVG